jgi:DNA-binding MarR family transcriptional regulator
VIDTPDPGRQVIAAGSAASDDPERLAARAVHMMGRDAERAWNREDALAWEGMLELSRRLRRQAEDILTRDDDLSVSMLGILGRLVRAEDMTLRPTALAEATGLSVSRVSRIIAMLEHRGLVECHACTIDARATDITVTSLGRDRTTVAQHRLFAFVDESFAGRLSPDETATLARVFARLLTDL